MKIEQLMNANGNAQKLVNVIVLDNEDEILTHYNTAVACKRNGVFYRTDKKHSTTTSKNINLYMGKGGLDIEQSFLDQLLENI